MNPQRSFRFSRAGISADSTANVSGVLASIICLGQPSMASGTAGIAGRKTRCLMYSDGLAMLWEEGNSHETAGK